METPIEYFKIFSSLNLQQNKENQNLKDLYLNKRININPNLYSKISKNINCNSLKNEKIKINTLKLPPNIKKDDKINEDAKIKIILEGIKDNKKELPKNNSNDLKLSSEFKKFKTELCHSWELTGTCKYDLNVR